MEQNPYNSDAALRRQVCDGLLTRMLRDIERPAPILLTLARAWSLVANGPGVGIDLSLLPDGVSETSSDL